ncbi:MAG: hypothetical protein ACRC3B_20075 [Bacteroidia bacterium]
MDATQTQPNGTFKITGDWAVQSKQLKEQFSQLTDADLTFEAGKEHDLLKKIETRLNKKRDEVINIIKKTQTEKS